MEHTDQHTQNQRINTDGTASEIHLRMNHANKWLKNGLGSIS